jgi:hypothetical protein
MVYSTTAGVGALAFAVWAQEEQEGESSCTAACYDAEDLCYESCDDSDDPASCEMGCRVETDACLEACE